MRGLAGKRAVVTGAASGIGHATARRLMEEGVRVLAIDCNAITLPGADVLLQDVTETGAPEAMAAAALARLGGLDILVNNAGISPFALFEEMSEADWSRTLSINFDAVARYSRAALPLLKQSAAARIINVASSLSSFAWAGLSAYVSSKHAVLGLTRALATELGQYNITVNAVQPGAIYSGISQPAFDADPSAKTMWETKAALGRIGEPEEVAGLIAFLASADASFISGHGIFIDGAALAHI